MVTAFRRMAVETILPAADRRLSVSGFTLIEMVVALAIVAILVVVALPSYEEQLLQGRRSDATTALVTFAQRVERHFLESGSYSGATTTIYRDNSDRGYYTLSITATDNSYQLQASPTGAQLQDLRCNSFTLNERGERGITGSASGAECWQ